MTGIEPANTRQTDECSQQRTSWAKMVPAVGAAPTPRDFQSPAITGSAKPAN